MALASGTRLGAYEIVALLGAGGMGEVYRARDATLGRDVAIKVLPDFLAGDADRMARFTREARTLASLNHPNIAHIHGLEDCGGVRALVMELVEGDDLSRRIARGAIRLDAALPIAKQIAKALEAAHEQGIVHRDLKPANIKVMPDGTVKVLDFGLAKTGTASEAGGEPTPTVTSPAMMTSAGMILGTAAYMSPEQARGQTVDKRSDIWAFGCVLYEMLTGKRAFLGEDLADTISNVLKTEPNWSAFPSDLPVHIRPLMMRCLAKDRAERIPNIAVVRFLLDDVTAVTPDSTRPPQQIGRRGAALVVASLMVAAAAVVLAAWMALRPPPTVAPRPATRFRITVPPDTLLINPTGDSGGTGLALSPDGSLLAYVARLGASGEYQLYTQASDQLDAVPIRGARFAAGSGTVFFSPNAEWIGFHADGKLHKVPSVGGAALTLCDAPGLWGATWMPDDSIVFGSRAANGLLRVSAAGGTPTQLTKPDGNLERSHRWPEVLPGGKAIVFAIQRPNTDFNGAAIGVLRLDTGEWSALFEGGTAPHYLPSGHLTFVRDGVMLAVPFDLGTLQVTGAAVPLIDGVFASVPNGAAKLAVSETGSIAYVPGGAARLARAMVWVDRHGMVQPLPVVHQTYEAPRLSPDGQRVAVAVNNAAAAGDRNIWMYDVARTTLSKLTAEKVQAESPAWTPDGRLVTYVASRSPLRHFMRKAADGSGTEETLAGTDRHLHSGSWSPKGDALIAGAVQGAEELWILQKRDTWTLRPYLKAAFRLTGPVISPDGRWLAYASSENNRGEIYVQAFPEPGGKYQISTDGGAEPVWAKNGRELFYRNGDKMMAVSIDTHSQVPNAGTPAMLFEGRFAASSNDAWYDVSADGQHFLMLTPGDALAPDSIVVIHDWMNEVTALAPSRK